MLSELSELSELLDSELLDSELLGSETLDLLDLLDSELLDSELLDLLDLLDLLELDLLLFFALLALCPDVISIFSETEVSIIYRNM